MPRSCSKAQTALQKLQTKSYCKLAYNCASSSSKDGFQISVLKDYKEIVDIAIEARNTFTSLPGAIKKLCSRN